MSNRRAVNVRFAKKSLQNKRAVHLGNCQLEADFKNGKTPKRRKKREEESAESRFYCDGEAMVCPCNVYSLVSVIIRVARWHFSAV